MIGEQFLEGFTRKDIEIMSELIAEKLVHDGVDRIITQEILQERCRHYTDIAKKEVEACGPETDADRSSFTPTATVFAAQGWEAPNVRVGFKDGYKRRMMWALSQTCKIMLAQAVIIRIVATTTDMTKIAGAMNLRVPDPLDRHKCDYFEERMWKWIEKNYGRQRLSALPPEFRRDCIMIGGMGPRLQDTGVLTEYHWENGKLIFGESSEGGVHVEMIPRWWQ